MTTDTPRPVPASLGGKSVLITGAAKRVGAEIARVLHAAGASVLLHYRSSAEDAAALAALAERAAALIRPRPSNATCST